MTDFERIPEFKNAFGPDLPDMIPQLEKDLHLWKQGVDLFKTKYSDIFLDKDELNRAFRKADKVNWLHMT